MSFLFSLIVIVNMTSLKNDVGKFDVLTLAGKIIVGCLSNYHKTATTFPKSCASPSFNE